MSLRRTASWPLAGGTLWRHRALQLAIWAASRPERLLAAAAGILASGLLAMGLGSTPLAGWDEAIYGMVAKQMLWRGDWLTPWANGMPWFDKPPLFMDLMALSYRIFGISDWAARLPSVLFAGVTVGVVVLIAHRLYGLRVAALSAGMLPLMPLFAARARLADLDMALLAFTSLALYSYLKANRCMTWAFGLWVGLAIMIKGAGGLMAPLIVAGYALLAMDRRALAGWTKAATVAVLVILPWHVIETLRMGRAFWDSYLVYHVLDRTTRPIEGHTGGPLTYLPYLAHDLKILAVPTVLGGWFALRRVLRGATGSKGDRLVLAWALVPLVVFSLVRTKIFWYMLPCYPGFAILAALGTDRVLSGAREWVAGVPLRRLAVGMALLLAFAVALHHLEGIAWQNPDAIAEARLATEAGHDTAPGQALYVWVPDHVVHDASWYFSHTDPHIHLAYAPALVYYSDRRVHYLITPAERQGFHPHAGQLVLMDDGDMRDLARFHPVLLDRVANPLDGDHRSMDPTEWPFDWCLVRIGGTRPPYAAGWRPLTPLGGN